MQFIRKRPEPPKDWPLWFSTATGRRSFDYKADERELTNLSLAKKFLLEEQKGLCAYCQSELTSDNSSIEHVIPKSANKEFSTDYHNLVAVCKKPLKDPETGRSHCDKERGDKLLPSIIFHDAGVNDRCNNQFFDALGDGTIRPKPKLEPEIEKQVSAFIEILNLNHPVLAGNRKQILGSIIDVYRSISEIDHLKKDFWKIQLNRFLKDESLSYRQFIMIYLSKKVGRN